jgi:hypothetical protein
MERWMADFKIHAYVGVAAGLGVTIWEHRKIKEKDPSAELAIWKGQRMISKDVPRILGGHKFSEREPFSQERP